MYFYLFVSKHLPSDWMTKSKGRDKRASWERRIHGKLKVKVCTGKKRRKRVSWKEMSFENGAERDVRTQCANGGRKQKFRSEYEVIQKGSSGWWCSVSYSLFVSRPRLALKRSWHPVPRRAMLWPSAQTLRSALVVAVTVILLSGTFTTKL